MNATSTFSTEFGKVTIFNNDYHFASEYSKGIHWDGGIIRDTLSRYVQKAKVILDIGSHVGSHSIAYNKINPSAHIYAFEPQKHIYRLLVKNICDNSAISKVTPVYSAVGNKCGIAHMASRSYDLGIPVEYDSGKGFNYGGLSLGVDGEQVPLMTIDSMNLDACDFIKIDVEGAEPLAFMGAALTILKYKPVIYFECNERDVTEDMKKDLNITTNIPAAIDVLKAYGYTNFVKVTDFDILALPE